jgi:hypothetical protein
MKKRVVVSLVDTPQKHDGRPSPEQVKSMGGDVPEALLFHLVCAQETEQELLCATGDVVVLQTREMTTDAEVHMLDTAEKKGFEEEWKSQRTGRRYWEKLPSSRPTQFSNQLSNLRILASRSVQCRKEAMQTLCRREEEDEQ